MEQKQTEQNVEYAESNGMKEDMMETDKVNAAETEEGVKNFRAIWSQDDDESAIQAGVTPDGNLKDLDQLSDDERAARTHRIEVVSKTMSEFKTAYGAVLPMIRADCKTIQLLKLRKVPTDAVVAVLMDVEAKQKLRVLSWAK